MPPQTIILFFGGIAAGAIGSVFSLGAGVDKAFTDILKELRTQYLLGYYPKNVPLTSDPFHKLEIKAPDDLRVSARNGYYGETEHSSGRSGARIR